MSIEKIEKAIQGTCYVGSRDQRDTVVIRRASDLTITENQARKPTALDVG